MKKEFNSLTNEQLELIEHARTLGFVPGNNLYLNLRAAKHFLIDSNLTMPSEILKQLN